MPSLADIVRTAPTMGRFRPDPIPSPTIARAARRARLASWRVLPVSDVATRRAIRDAHLPHWRAHLLDSGGTRILAADQPAGLARKLRRADVFARELHEAPLHLVLLARTDGALRERAVDDLVAALEAEALGAVPLPLTARAAPELREVIDLGPALDVAELLVVGARR